MLKQAADSYPKMHKEIYLEYLSDGKPLLVKELAGLWLKEIKNTMRPSSYARYQKHMEKYILPYAGEIQAALFNADALSEMLAVLEKKYFLHGNSGKEELLSQYTLYLIESMVHAMFHYGVQNGIVPEVSFGKAEYKIKNKKAAMPLSELEIQQLLSIVQQKGTDYQLQVMLPLYTGMGLSELCGLKWEDICIADGKINIHRNIIRVQRKTEENKDKDEDIKRNKIINNDPATVFAECELPENECREFVMPEKLQKLLKSVYIAKRPSKQSYVAEVDKKSGRKRNVSIVEIVKKETKGKDTANINIVWAEPPDSRTLQYRLKTVGKTAWIDDLNFQRLRDTFTVMCLQAGGDIYSIAYVLGVGVTAVYDKYKEWLVRKDGFLKEIGEG